MHKTLFFNLQSFSIFKRLYLTYGQSKHLPISKYIPLTKGGDPVYLGTRVIYGPE